MYRLTVYFTAGGYESVDLDNDQDDTIEAAIANLEARRGPSMGWLTEEVPLAERYVQLSLPVLVADC